MVGPTGRLRIPYASSKPRGSLIGLLTNRPSSSRKVPIEVKLSSPEPISAVIENASAIYVAWQGVSERPPLSVTCWRSLTS